MDITDQNFASGSNAAASSNVTASQVTLEFAECRKNLECLVEAKKAYPNEACPSLRPRLLSMPSVQRLENLTRKQYFDLNKIIEASGLDSRFPTISYDPSSLTGTVYFHPFAPHEALSGLVAKHSMRCLGRNREISETLEDRMHLMGSVNTADTNDINKAIENDFNKNVDQTWFFEDDDGNIILHCIMECGVSQTAENILQIVRSRMGANPYIQTVLYVNVEEVSQDHSPNLRSTQNRQIFEKLQKLYHDGELRPVLANSDKPFGPWQIEGINWLGELSLVFEIWKRDSEGKPRLRTRHKFVPTKSSEKLHLVLKDFYPLDAMSAGDARLSLTWDNLQHSLVFAAKLEAQQRAFRGIRRSLLFDELDTDYVSSE